MHCACTFDLSIHQTPRKSADTKRNNRSSPLIRFCIHWLVEHPSPCFPVLYSISLHTQTPNMMQDKTGGYMNEVYTSTSLIDALRPLADDESRSSREIQFTRRPLTSTEQRTRLIAILDEALAILNDSDDLMESSFEMSCTKRHDHHKRPRD